MLLDYFMLSRLLRPNAQQQTEALLATMVEILMIIAEKSKVTIVLPGNEAYIPHSISYFQDSVTEKVFFSTNAIQNKSFSTNFIPAPSI